MFDHPFSRHLLRRSAVGFGCSRWPRCLPTNPTLISSKRFRQSIAPRPPHFAARAKRVIFLFMKGGPSHLDTFDPKPLLTRDDGKPVPFAKPRVVCGDEQLLKSPWEFKQLCQSGIPVSSLFRTSPVMLTISA
jgi:hypothetical protein